MNNNSNENCVISLKGLHCAACVNRVETSLKKNEGIFSANVNLTTQQAHIEYDSSKISVEDMKQTVIDAGYEVVEVEGKINFRP